MTPPRHPSESRNLANSLFKKIPAFAGMTAILLLLAACTSAQSDTYQNYLAGRHVAPSNNTLIHHCRGYGCKFVDDIALSAEDWKDIAAAMSPPAQNAAEERARITRAIGAFERKIGPKNGTNEDLAGTFRSIGDHQLDCVDESTNTTSYLATLLNQGLLRYHTLEAPVMRWPIINAGRWPHQTAVIRETASQKLYAVDSWFHDNGEDAEIIELDKWKEGWKPDSVHGLL